MDGRGGGEVSDAEEAATDHAGAPEVEPASGEDLWGAEILKVLMGADVELEAEFLGSTCVEGDGEYPD